MLLRVPALLRAMGRPRTWCILLSVSLQNAKPLVSVNFKSFLIGAIPCVRKWTRVQHSVSFFVIARHCWRQLISVAYQLFYLIIGYERIRQDQIVRWGWGSMHDGHFQIQYGVPLVDTKALQILNMHRKILFHWS